MSDYITAFLAAPHWVFIALGGILLIIELLGTGGYALWSGISALLVGLLVMIMPFIPWSILWLLFALFTLITAYLWWLWLKKKPKGADPASELNQMENELLGVKTVVTDAIINGRGRVKIKDGTWSATANENLPVGTFVNVIAVDGLLLTVEKSH